MRRSKALSSIFFAIATCIVFGCNAAAQNSKRPGLFDPSGNYHPVVRLDGDDRFLQFNLRVKREKGDLSFVGEVRNPGRWYKFSGTTINENGVRFLTYAIGGIRYQFDCTFSGKGNFARQWSGKGIVMANCLVQKHTRAPKNAVGSPPQEFRSEFVYYPPHS